MDKLFALPEVGKRLGMSPTNARKLLHCNIIRDFQVVAGRTYVPESEVSRLVSVPLIEVREPTLQVRVAETTDVNDDDQIRQWWPVADPDTVVGHLLAATVAGFPLRALRVLGYETSAGRRSFTVDDKIGDYGKYILSGRWPSQQGPISKLWLPN